MKKLMKKIIYVFILLTFGYANKPMHGMKHSLVLNNQNNQNLTSPFENLISTSDGKALVQKTTDYLGLSETNKFMQASKQLYQWLSQENRAAILHKKMLNFNLLKKWQFIRDRVHEGDTTTLENLLKAIVNTNQKSMLLNKSDIMGRSLFHTALEKGHSSTAGLLLDHGAQGNITQPAIHPLVRAAYDGDIAIIQKLIAKIGVSQANNQINQALLAASANGHADIVQLLLDSGANVNAADNDGTTALVLASIYKHSDIVRLLLNKRGINVHLYDKNRHTALIQASAAGHTDIVQLLLNHGAQIHEADNIGLTSIWWASINGHTDTVKLLLNNGANVHLRDKNDNTILMHAAFKGHFDIVQLLLKYGAKINAANSKGDTALMTASFRGHADVVQLLLNQGADVNISSKSGLTALWEASYGGHTNIVQLLLDHDADVNISDKNGKTALMKAREKGNLAVVELLSQWKNPLAILALVSEADQLPTAIDLTEQAPLNQPVDKLSLSKTKPKNATTLIVQLPKKPNNIALSTLASVANEAEPSSITIDLTKAASLKQGLGKFTIIQSKPRYACTFAGCKKSYVRKDALKKHIATKHS